MLNDNGQRIFFKMEEKLQIEMKEIEISDRKVFRLLFDTFFPRACFFAGHILHDREAGADVAQETFLVIWQKGERFASVQVFKSYLYTALKYKCLNILRDRPEMTDVDGMKELPAEEVRIDHLIIREEIRGRILCEINKLPEIKRDIMLLRLEGRSYEDISGELGLSLNTVKAHKKESYKRLRISLSGREELTMMCLLSLGVILGV